MTSSDEFSGNTVTQGPGVSIEQAIRFSEIRAKTFWVFSIFWLATMIAVATIFSVSIYQFNETKKDLVIMRGELSTRMREIELSADAQKRQANQLIEELEKTKSALSSLEKTMLDRLDDYGKQIHVLNLQRSNPNNLSQVEQNFIREEGARRSDQNDNEATARQLVVTGFSRYLDGNYREALDIYNRAITLDRNFLDAYVGRARVNLMLGALSQAYSDATQAIELAGGEHTYELYRLRATIFIRLEKYEDAQRDLLRAAKDAPGRADMLNVIGLADLLRKDFVRAELDFRSGGDLALTPSLKANILENVGLIYLANEDWKSAFDWTFEVSRIADAGEWNLLIRAISAAKLGKKEELRRVVDIISRLPMRAESLDDFEAYLFSISPDLSGFARRFILHDIQRK